MEPFATIDDLNARRASDLTGRAASVAQAKLADASAKLAAEMDASGIPWRARVTGEIRPPSVCFCDSGDRKSYSVSNSQEAGCC